MGAGRGTSANARIRWFAFAAAIVAPLTTSAMDIGSDARIVYFETLDQAAVTTTAAQKTAASATLQFNAYGRHFDLALDRNDALISDASGVAASKLRSASLQLYRGRLAGNAQSWARLARKDEQLHGMIWDGTELYVIEPAAQVRDSLVTAAAADAATTVIFRLADVVIDPTILSCATTTAGDAASGSKVLEDLMRELKGSTSIMQAAGASRRLTISVLGDAAFLQRYANVHGAQDAILIRLNNVDGIYSAQLGVQIHVDSMSVNDASSDPLSDATSPSSLLAELGRLRKRSPSLNSRGLTHLFTGRDLEGSTIGMAYVDSLCQAEHGVALTEAQSTWRDSLVAAHEIGHNFGADHDGDAAGSCAAAPTGFLMAPAVSGNDAFSQCSIERMRPRILTAKCITGLPPANVAVAGDLGTVRRAVSTAFEWSLDITNAGGLSATDVRAELLVPPVMKIEDAYVGGGSCTSGAGVIQCQLGDVPGTASRSINLVLRSDVIGTNSISARISSASDSASVDNRGEGVIVIEAEADLAVALQGPASAVAAQSFTLNYSVTNYAPISASDISLVITLPADVVPAVATLGNGTCAAQDGGIRCTLSSLPAGASAVGTVSVSTSAPGTVALQATVSGSYVDPNSQNDAAALSVRVESVPQAVTKPGTGGSGGGGSTSLVLILATAGLHWTRRLRSRT
jgi:Metallo-peptidase family M12/Domain of unknown function DUF11/Reprolysin family propeptide